MADTIYTILRERLRGGVEVRDNFVECTQLLDYGKMNGKKRSAGSSRFHTSAAKEVLES